MMPLPCGYYLTEFNDLSMKNSHDRKYYYMTFNKVRWPIYLCLQLRLRCRYWFFDRHVRLGKIH